MLSVQTYVESRVAMAFDSGAAAWVFALDHWGRCGQGRAEDAALDDLSRQITQRLGVPVELVVVERMVGDELAFARDRLPCTDPERAATVRILEHSRRRTLRLIGGCSDAVLDWDDPDRTLPPWARWRTLRQMAWHVTDTESRYYLPCTGLPSRPRAGDLTTALAESVAHVRDVVETMPAGSGHTAADGTAFTAVKLLRRLAWHERSELDTMTALAAKARRYVES